MVFELVKLLMFDTTIVNTYTYWYRIWWL